MVEDHGIARRGQCSLWHYTFQKVRDQPGGPQAADGSCIFQPCEDGDGGGGDGKWSGQ